MDGVEDLWCEDDVLDLFVPHCLSLSLFGLCQMHGCDYAVVNIEESMIIRVEGRKEGRKERYLTKFADKKVPRPAFPEIVVSTI